MILIKKGAQAITKPHGDTKASERKRDKKRGRSVEGKRGAKVHAKAQEQTKRTSTHITPFTDRRRTSGTLREARNKAGNTRVRTAVAGTAPGSGDSAAAGGTRRETALTPPAWRFGRRDALGQSQASLGRRPHALSAIRKGGDRGITGVGGGRGRHRVSASPPAPWLSEAKFPANFLPVLFFQPLFLAQRRR